MLRSALVGLATVLLAGPALPAADQPRDTARLRALDKVTARTTTFDVPVREEAAFGTLSVAVDACFAAPPTAMPESAAFLRIVDNPPNGESAEVFSGWMFASSPAVSALDHAVFDVWVIACLDAPVPITADEAQSVADRSPPRRRP
jgi:hypothetical protein